MKQQSAILFSACVLNHIKGTILNLHQRHRLFIPPVAPYCFIFPVVLLFFSQSGFSQIEVGFTADVTSGCSPISVSFSNQSQPIEGSTYLWDFGNGNFSTAVTPQTTYIEPGSYTVTLTVTNNEVSETMTKEGFITVYSNPEAKFELIGDTIGCSPSEFGFTNLSSDSEGSSLTYVWSFGDGGKSTDENPVHTYITKGVFDVTLLVENQNGCFDSHTQGQLIHVFKPVAQFGADQTQSCTGALTTAFTNLSEGESPLLASWDFGDGVTSTTFSPMHQYNTTGVYSVNLVVEDPYGCKGEITRQDLIQIVKTTADFTVSKDTLCRGQNLLLTNKSLHADQYLWKFDDQTTSTSENTSKKYSESGDHTIWLIATRGSCRDSVSKTINIDYVKAGFTPADSFLCELPVTLNYIDQSENAVNWDWRFGNGTISQLKNPTVTYPSTIRLTNNMAVFTDTLIVTSKHGCTDKKIRENSVTIQIPDVKFSPGTGGEEEQLNICIPATLTFTDKTDYSTPFDYVTEKHWHYKTQSAGNGDQIEIPVSETGELDIELTIITAKGCVHKKSETINAGQKVSPDFYRVGDYSVCASEPVNFVVTAPESSLITNGSWDFGDGSEEMLQMPPHNFIKSGPMDVTFTVFNYGCSSSVTKKDIVNIMGPVASFEAIVDCNTPYERILQGSIEEATSYEWNLGDNSPILRNQNTITHTFTDKGEYNITLTASNSNNGCTYEFSRTLYIRDVKSDFEITDGTPCQNNVLTLDGSKSVDAVDYFINNENGKYLWTIKEDNKTYFTTGPVSHKFTQKGTYNVSLMVQDINGCSDTLEKEIIIYKPDPDFEANYSVGCMPVTFEFSDLSQSAAPIISWNWNFGDGLTSSEQHPVHDYTSYGNYNVSLKITDEIGCSSTLVKSQIVKAILPDASFKAYDNTLCPGDSSSFIDLSDSEIVDYQWETSDGQISDLEKPHFYFNTPGFYTVNLKITDNHGCEASHTLENYIHVQPFPKADFSADITNSNCYPLIVQFFDESENEFPGSWEWHFGENDNLSELKDPFFIYNRPGHHDVHLINRTSYGCADTIVKPQFIHVGGPYATIALRDTVCQNLNVLFVAENQLNVHDIRWDFGDGYSGDGNQAVHQYRNAGTVYPVMFVRSDEENTCNKAIIDTITVLDLQARFSLKDGLDKGCVPFEPSLINESVNATDWLWEFGNGTILTGETPQYQYPEAGTYNMRLIALHTLGCSDTTNLQPITVFPLPTVKTSKDTVICAGTTATLWASGGSDYSWISPETLENPNVWQTNALPDITTLYQVQVTDQNGCVNFGDVLVAVQQKPEITLKDTTLIIGEYISPDLSDPGISSYFWSPSEHISCTLCPNPVIQPMKSTTYQVAITDTSNCFTVNYPLNITILEQYSVDVPGAFTPNGDGVNDVIYVKGWGIKAMVSFKIFNRLGQEVFSSTELEEGWDGTYKGKAQPSETYSYITEVETYSGETLLKAGVFKLIR